MTEQVLPRTDTRSRSVEIKLAGAMLETKALTLVYWTSALGFAAAFWVTRFPPCIDYPQHLALAATIARMADPSSPERALYEITPLTYNGLFQFSAAALALFMRAETAGRLLLSTIPLFYAAAGLELMRAARRPSWYAFALLPFAYSHALGWGFVNYCIGTALALWVLARFVRWSRGEGAFLPGIVAVSLLVAFSHVLVTMALCIGVATVVIARRTADEAGFATWCRESLRLLLPLAPAALYTLLVFRSHRVAPNIEWYPDKDGLDDPAWLKIVHFLHNSVGNLSDGSDLALFGATLAIVLVLFVSRYFGGTTLAKAERPIAWLAVVFSLLYLVVPRVVASTWFVYERLTLWATAFVVAGAPIVTPALATWLRPLLAALALAATASTLHAFAKIPDGEDASAIIDAIPEGSRVLGLTYSSHAEPGIWRRIWVHQVAYAMVRRRVETAHQFTRYASLPLRYQAALEPARALGGLEWDATLYDPDAAYARHYDTVLIRTPDDAPFEDPRELAFGREREIAQPLAHHGRFWLFRIKSDATNLLQQRTCVETCAE